MNHRNARFLLIVILLLPVSASAQDIEPRAAGTFQLVSRPAGAEIWLGDSLLGTTPMQIDTALWRRVTVEYPSRRAWKSEIRTLGGEVISSAQGVVRVEFSEWKRVLSSPSGAEVMEGDSILGRTPCDIPLRSGAFAVSLRYPGYRSVSLSLAAGDGEASLIVLERETTSAQVGVLDLQKPQFTLPPARILVPAGIGLAAGVTSVILKQKADKEYARYTASLDRALLTSTRRYDLLAAVSLGILELCVGYFVTLLLLEH